MRPLLRSLAAVLATLMLLWGNGTPAYAANYSSGGSTIACWASQNWFWNSSTSITWSSADTCTDAMSYIGEEGYLRRQTGWFFWQWSDIDSCYGNVHGVGYQSSCTKTSSTVQEYTLDHEIRTDWHEAAPAGYSPTGPQDGSSYSGHFEYP